MNSSFRLISCVFCILGVWPASAQPVRLTDATGVTVELAAVPQRIVSQAPSNTELLFALGLGDHVVGVTTYCDYPPQAKQKPRIGDMQTMSAERVLAQNPDLVLSHEIVAEPLRRQLINLGVPVFTLAPHSVRNILDDITTVGRLCGAVAEASAVREILEQRIARVKETVRCATRTPVVYYGSLRAPLWAAGTDTYVDELIRWAGGHNACAGLGSGWHLVSTERLLAVNPDVIIQGLAEPPATDADRAALVRQFQRDPVLNRISAVRNAKVFFVDENWTARSGPRVVDALDAFAQAIHPECFAP